MKWNWLHECMTGWMNDWMKLLLLQQPPKCTDYIIICTKTYMATWMLKTVPLVIDFWVLNYIAHIFSVNRLVLHFTVSYFGRYHMVTPWWTTEIIRQIHHLTYNSKAWAARFPSELGRVRITLAADPFPSVDASSQEQVLSNDAINKIHFWNNRNQCIL